MLRERCRFSVTVFGKNLFAFGGISETTEEEEELIHGGGGDNGNQEMEGVMCERYTFAYPNTYYNGDIEF